MNENVKHYLVLLQPLAPFFFGGEQGQTADYYLTGNYFPQQTALLGLVRHQLLIQNGLLHGGRISDTGKAANLVGSESFQYNSVNQSFGVIKNIGTCHLCYFTNNNSLCQYHAAPPPFVYEIARVSDNYMFPGYGAKIHYASYYSDLDNPEGSAKLLADEDVFSKHERPGIDKDYNGKPKDEAYYKQVWLTLKKDFSFGFHVSLEKSFNGEQPVVFEDAYVSFGKESSPFLMSVKEVAVAPEQQPVLNHGQNALYLTSDTYSSMVDLTVNCRLSVTDTIPFRNIVNSISQKRELYYNKKPAQTESRRLQLYKKGSFFYAENIKAIADNISSHKQFARIGYNQFTYTTTNILP